MTRFTILFPLLALIMSISVSHMVVTNGVLFPSLQFPKEGTFLISKPMQGDSHE